MKPKFNDHSLLRFLAEILFILHVFLWLLMIYSISKSQFEPKQHNDKTQWHLVP